MICLIIRLLADTGVGTVWTGCYWAHSNVSNVLFCPSLFSLRFQRTVSLLFMTEYPIHVPLLKMKNKIPGEALTYLLTDLLTYWLTGLLTDLLTDWLTDLLTYWLPYWLTYLPTYLLTDLLTGLLTYWLTYSLTDLLTYLLTYLLTHSLHGAESFLRS